MTRPMTVRERIVITLAVCLSMIVAIPMTVLAATGQLVNIIDPSNAARQARVTAVGALQVEARLGIQSGAIALMGQRTSNGWLNAGSGATNKLVAITELTVSSTGPTGWFYLDIAYAAPNPTCTVPSGAPSAWRRLRIDTNTTQQFLFPTPLFTLGLPAAGSKWCIGAQIVQAPANTLINFGASGYSFTP